MFMKIYHLRVACIQKLAQQYGFKVDVTDDAGRFTEENLSKYSLLIFPSTNQDVFDNDEQRLAFRRYIEAGGGFVGIHSAIGTERNWELVQENAGRYLFMAPGLSAIHGSGHRPISSIRWQGVPAEWVREDELLLRKKRCIPAYGP